MGIMEARMTQANYALRLQASIKAEAERLARAEGTTLDQFINVAVAEKIAALPTADCFRERARRANVEAAPTLRTLLKPRLIGSTTTGNAGAALPHARHGRYSLMHFVLHPAGARRPAPRPRWRFR